MAARSAASQAPTSIWRNFVVVVVVTVVTVVVLVVVTVVVIGVHTRSDVFVGDWSST